MSGLAGVALESVLMSARSSAVVAYPDQSMDLGNGPMVIIGADSNGQRSGVDPLAQAPFTEEGTPKGSNRRPVTWEQQLVSRFGVYYIMDYSVQDLLMVRHFPLEWLAHSGCSIITSSIDLSENFIFFICIIFLSRL